MTIYLKLNDKEIELSKVFDFVRTHSLSKIEIQLQSAPVKEVGVNGLQIEDVTLVIKDILCAFDESLPCKQTSNAIVNLELAYAWLIARKENREKRGVEGTNNA